VQERVATAVGTIVRAAKRACGKATSSRKHGVRITKDSLPRGILRPRYYLTCRALVMTLFMLRRVRNCRSYYYYYYHVIIKTQGVGANRYTPRVRNKIIIINILTEY